MADKVIDYIDKIVVYFAYFICFIVLLAHIFFGFDGFGGDKKNNKNITKNKDVAGFIACHTTYSLLNNLTLKNTCFNKLKGE